jgi:hypothetical protein
MRLLASLSKELDTDVAFDSASGVGKIALGDWQSHESTRDVTTTIAFKEENGYWISEPVRIEDPGFLSAIVSLSGIPAGAGLDASLGREQLLHGGFEYEGGWLWKMNDDDIFLETMYPHGGTYCLGVRRTEGQSSIYSELEDRIPINENSRYTIDGWIAGSNADGARFGVEFYNYRFSGGSFDDAYVNAQDGDIPWTRLYLNFESPNDGWYVNYRCRAGAPSSGTGTAYFDDLALIEWTSGWTPISTGTTDIPYPNESTYFQIRCNQQVDTALVTYRLTEREIY